MTPLSAVAALFFSSHKGNLTLALSCPLFFPIYFINKYALCRQSLFVLWCRLYVKHQRKKQGKRRRVPFVFFFYRLCAPSSLLAHDMG